MPERPRPPAAALATWLALVADAIALIVLFRSHQPVAFKASAGGVDVLGVYTIVVFYLGRRWEWFRLDSHRRQVAQKRPSAQGAGPVSASADLQRTEAA